MAIIIRCRMPPLNWCGYCRSRRAGSEMPTIASSSSARRRASAGDSLRWISRPSVSWRPMLSTGLSEVIGSWNTMPISRPRTRRISSSPSLSRSRPLKRIWPPTMRPAGAATSRMMLSALTDLPHPDSPTSATVSPSRTSHDTPSTARTTPPRVAKCVWRLRTSKSVPTTPRSVAPRRGTSSHSAGGFAPRPTVVARLTARSFLPPPRTGLRRQSRRSKRATASAGTTALHVRGRRGAPPRAGTATLSIRPPPLTAKRSDRRAAEGGGWRARSSQPSSPWHRQPARVKRRARSPRDDTPPRVGGGDPTTSGSERRRDARPRARRARRTRGTRLRRRTASGAASPSGLPRGPVASASRHRRATV